MDAYKKLPVPLQIGIPVVVLLLVLFLVKMTMFAAETPTVIVDTQDAGVFAAAKTVLDSRDIPFTDEADAAKNQFTISVLESDKTLASTELAKSGIKDRSGNAKPIECPAPPGFTGTKAANERSNNCEDSKSVQDMLITAGASAANVKVSQVANETLLGPESSKSVLAQVFLPTTTDGAWPADQAARAIATAVGTSIDRITLTDDRLQILFDGSRAGAAGAPGAAAGVGSGAGCADMATATEIATKEAAVRSCYKDTIGAELQTLLGGSDRFVLSVQAKIEATAKTSQSISNRRGAVRDRSRQSGSGSSLDDVAMEPDSTSRTSTKPAGDIQKLAITVALDANYVDDRQELAVKRLLSTYVEPSRKDPAPNVTRIAFANGAGVKADTGQLEEIRAATTGPEAKSTGVRTETVQKTPPFLIALIGVIGAGLLVAILVLWRRGATAAKDRERYELEFQNQQRVLDTYAQQDPASVARDLESLFGAPAAPEPQYR